jgi:hypothetical protein
VGVPNTGDFYMKSFIDWTKEEKLDLPTFTDAPAAEKTVEEKTKRTGLNANYPDAYVAAQYPHKYFNPTKATADLDLSTRKK